MKFAADLLERLLLEDAAFYAEDGIAVTRTMAENTRLKQSELRDAPGFAESYLVDGDAPGEGSRFRQPRLAATIKHLMRHGLDSFYRGELARRIASDLEGAGTPLRLADLERHRGQCQINWA